jgi:hypothetical protein
MRIDGMKVFTAVFACFVFLASASYAHAASFTIGGTVSGLTTGKSVTLLDNGGDALTVAVNGKFTFKTALATGATYNVTVGTQPTGESCTVTAGSGTVGTVNVTTVKVACKVPTFTIGGTASGLVAGRSVTLLDNGGSALKVAKNGAFTFKTALPTGAAYNVTISIQAVGETCTVTGGSGTVGTSNVTSVVVACTPKPFTIGGTVSGLTTGKSVTLLDNGADSLVVAANSAFTFAKTVLSGSPYKVTVKVQPVGETCTVTGGAGTVVASNIITVVVACKPKTFTIGGTVSGLSTGASVTLLDNGADSLAVTVNGKFTFKTAVASGSTYNVTVGTQPTGETCTVTGGSGTVVAANVATVKVVCASSSTFTIGGTVSGLNSGTSVTLLDNGTDSLTVAANGAFTFKTALATGAAYSVTVGTQPTGETCTVTGGSGKVGTVNVTTVKVTCAAAKTFTIGGTVSGLNSGTSVTLLDNGTDSLPVPANGAFTFKTALASGAAYSVTVGTQPTGETCTVTNGSGTVGSANVTNVAVACSSSTGGGGAYWIPYSAFPTPNVTPVGQNGLFLIPSDKLSSSPAPTWVTTDTTQLLGIGTQITVTGGVATYSPQVIMYADTDSTGITRIFGLTLAGTGTVPTPTQISNLAVPSGQQICSVGASAETDVTQPTTLFAVLEVGTLAQCGSGGGTFEVVHYTDAKTTAPVVVSISTTQINSVYQNGKLVGLLLLNGSALDLYATDAFTSPVAKITGLTTANYVTGVLNEATLSTTAVYYQVSTTTANELYRIDGSTLAATLVQNMATGSIGNPVVQDDTNVYYTVLTPGATNTETATINQVAIAGGTPKALYTTPSFEVLAGTLVDGYQLVGSNDSIVVFEFSSSPYTSGIQDPTKSTATLFTVPVGVTTTSPTTLANYTAGNELPDVFLAAPSGSGYAANVLFATVEHSTGTFPLYTRAYSAVSIPLNGGQAPPPIANSVYEPLAIISSHLTDSVWQVTGITDTNGGYGGGTANLVNVSNLTDTPFTTTGGGHYVFAAGFSGSLAAISSNNIAIGIINNSAALLSGGGTLEEDGAAADLSSDFLYQIKITNTEIVPY